MRSFVRLLLSINAITSSGFCANILFVSLLPSPSHHIWNEVLVGGLLENGHNITMIGHDKATIKSNNYTVLHISGLYEKMNELFEGVTLSSMTSMQSVNFMNEYSLLICEHDLKSDELAKLMSYPRHSFDMILFDITTGQCFYPLVEYFGNPPFVAVSAYGLPPFIADAMGCQINTYIPFYSLPYSDHMTLLQRLGSVLLINYELIMKRYYLPVFRKRAQSVFGDDIRTFDLVEADLSLLISCIDAIMDYPQSLPPNIIPAGGLHAKPAKKLPEDLIKMMNDAKNGVVYISFGTNVKARDIGIDKIRAFVEAFSKLSEIVFWKLDEEIPNLPENVIMRKWFPQNDLLAHTNLKLFITHGGGLSTQEAKYHGVPVIGVPFMVDQYNNMGKVEQQNLGIKLDYSTLTSEKIYDTIMEVMGNQKYRNNMKQMSKKFRDQPQTPLDRAVFWIEHVLRNGDAKHLEPAARHMKVYQTLHLDLFLVIIATMLSLVFAMYTIACLITSALRKNPTEKIKKH